MILALEIFLLLYFAYVSLYALFLAVAALFYKSPPATVASSVKNRIAILIPSYKEDSVIVSVARDALRQNYPKEKYDVVVIADSLKPHTLSELKSLPIILLEVSFEKSTKVNSLNHAFRLIGDQYDFALILDADNVMEENFLEKLNSLLSLGYKAIQAERIPKNQTTSISVLDGFSERINNFIYRQGHVAAGLSCSLIGSGMIFEFPLVKNILSKLKSVGGFDRELELDLIRRGIKIQYAKGVFVYDEKVETPEVFEKQRTRWLSSQFIYLRKYFTEGCVAFVNGNWSMFNSAILKNIQLPRVVNLGLLIVLTILTFLIRKHLTFGFYPWLIFLMMNVVAIALAIPLALYNRKMFVSLFILPRVFLKMFNILFKLKGANKSFLHTPHGSTNVSVNKEGD